METQFLLPNKGSDPPKFSAYVYCGQTAGWIKNQDATWHEGRPQPRRLYVRWNPAPLAVEGVEPRPQFSAHFYCGQTAAWIRMPLGTEVGLVLRDIVFDVDPAAPEKRHTRPHPIFGPCLLWPNGWMDKDAAWYGSRPRPRPHCTRRGSSSCERGTAAPSFRPMSIVTTVAHLSYC